MSHIYTHTHTHILTHTFTMEYYSTMKKDIQPFASACMNFEGIITNEMSDRERQIMYELTYM